MDKTTAKCLRDTPGGEFLKGQLYYARMVKHDGEIWFAVYPHGKSGSDKPPNPEMFRAHVFQTYFRKELIR